MPEFEVAIVHKEQTNYFVEAKDEDEAGDKAADFWQDGGHWDKKKREEFGVEEIQMGNEWAEIENIVISPWPDEKEMDEQDELMSKNLIERLDKLSKK